MNCPCSGVYVCAYIVIFLPWPAKKIWVSLRLLFFVSSLIPISPQRQKHREHQLHTTNTDKRTNYCVYLYSSVSSSPSASRLANYNKISLSNLTCLRLFWKTKKRQTGHRTVLPVSGFGVFEKNKINDARNYVKEHEKRRQK